MGPYSDCVWEMEDSIPPVHTTIAPLKSLNTKPSPLVQYSIVNVLYAYAFTMRLVNGDVSGGMRVEFVDTMMDVSQTLKASHVYESTAEALQSGAQAVGNGCYPSNPFPAVRAMEDTSALLAGDSESLGGQYTLAAISHLIRILGKAERSQDAQTNAGRADYYRARKKCGFLLSWVSEHRHTLPTLSAEAQHEYAACLAHLLQVQRAKNSLEKAWGAKRPPERKVLIEELDP
ncbi:zinc finger HIT domain-containing protein 2 [Narcine bancroftii]|uniref:zinc finger HIT domain-containing protein 2 n=1 Tax=Narcine bancroftii TaxID=1343680 RepID=UPI00383104F0